MWRFFGVKSSHFPIYWKFVKAEGQRMVDYNILENRLATIRIKAKKACESNDLGQYSRKLPSKRQKA